MSRPRNLSRPSPFVVSLHSLGLCSRVFGLIVSGFVVSVLCADAALAQDFVLREHLGRNWSNEVVTFPLSPQQVAAVKAGAQVLGPAGEAVVSQVLEKAAQPRLAFQVSLAPGATQSYRLGKAGKAAAGDWKIEESGGLMAVTNGEIGLRVRKVLKAGEGPLAGVRLRSGQWTGESTLGAGATVKSYSAEVAARGPVLVEIVCQVVFADDGVWSLRFRLERGEPVILVDESFDAPGGGTFRVTLGDPKFRPSHLLHRNSDVSSPNVMSDPIGGYLLEPWLRWNNPRHGNWIALHSPPPVVPKKGPEPTFDAPKQEIDADDLLGTKAKPATKLPPADPRDAASDMLVMGLLKPSLWVDPNWKGRAQQANPHANVAVRDGLVAVDLPVAGGRRVWLLGALSQRESVAILSQSNRRVAPPPQQLVIKHGDFPLEKVKNFVLDWPGDPTNFPRLYVRKSDLPAIKARLQSNPAILRKWIAEQPINRYLLDEPVQEFLAGGDPTLGKLMAAKAEEYLQNCVDWYLKQDERQTPGAAPHMQTLILSVVNLLDPVLGTEVFTPAARQRVLARLAFLGYVVSSPDYWSPERGYSGFANMTSVVAMYRTALGCLLQSHPQAKGWAELGLNQLTWQLGAWSDEDGGWIEAPHYAMVSFDHLLAGFAMAANAGYSDRLFDPRMRKVIEWFAGISTPRDARTGGWRHQPPIGNTYHGEPNGLYGIAASLWRERDPDFASRMQWLFEQHGSYPSLGSGWNFPTMLGYRFLMTSSGVKPKPAEFGSAWYRKTGVVLRNTMTDRETYLHLIAGPNHEHYDADSGSVVIYGKGRVLADDWGYLGRHPDQWHNMLTGPAANGYSQFDVTSFAAAPAFDYVGGRKGAWERQIGFAKDPDPLGPNFFVLRDTYTADGDVTWRLWLTTGITAGVGKQMPATLDKVPASPTASQPKQTDAVKDLFGDTKAKPAAASAAAPGTVALTAFGATLAGMEDVDLDIFIHERGQLGLSLEPAKLRTQTGNWMGSIQPVENSQIALTAKFKGRGVVTSLLFPRLKTEPSPTVRWSADGRIAEVKTKFGTDYVFVAPRPAAKPVGDGRTLDPLREVTTKDGVTTIAMSGDAQLNLRVNASKAGTTTGTDSVPAGAVALHPGPVNPVTAVWQSPVTGTVDIAVRLRDGDAGGGDGILCELRHGPKVLAKGALQNGGRELLLRADKLAVAKGDLVRLVILPGQTNPTQSNWWDTTVTEMEVRSGTGQRWDLRESLLRGDGLGNQLARDWDQAVWWVCSGDAEKFDPRALILPAVETYSTADAQASFQGVSGAVRLRGAKTTLTLGAAGKIRVGNKELSANQPATKE